LSIAFCTWTNAVQLPYTVETDDGEPDGGEGERSCVNSLGEISIDVVIITKEPSRKKIIARVSLDITNAPAEAAGSLTVRSNDSSMASLKIPIAIKEARLRPSRDKIIARVGAGTQAMLSLRGSGGASMLTDEHISLYNEGQAPLKIRDIAIHDADWASVHPVQEDLSLEGRTVLPMSPPASLDLIVRIDASVRGAHNLTGTMCISSNDPRPDVLIPIEASLSLPADCPPACCTLQIAIHRHSCRHSATIQTSTVCSLTRERREHRCR
jgi:hypothetical protein